MPSRNPGWRPLAVLLVLFLCPDWAHAQERGSSQAPGLKLPTVVAGAAAAADWVSTYHALSNYHVREMNPLLQPLQRSPGKMVTLGAAIDVAGVSAWNLTVGQKHPKVAAAGLWVMAGFRAYLAFHNFRNAKQSVPRARQPAGSR